MPDPSTLFVIIVFSVVGIAAFRHGKRESNMVCLVLGIVLMVYSYFVEGLALNLLVGAALSGEVIRTFGQRIPILGVCLGLQCIGEVYGGHVVRSDRLMHGKTSPIIHMGKGVFRDLPSPFEATRYHSLIVKRDTLPDVLEITTETAEGEIMGLQHKTLPVHGVQFHPESVLTTEGKRLLKNFLGL